MTITIRALAMAMLGLGLATANTNSYANVIIAGTRVIFPAKDGEVTVRLTNQNATPALIEAWVDDGNKDTTPDKVHTPFLIAPPLFRIEARRDQSLRILFTHSDKPLPSDRETVFWLNVLEIPPKPSGPQVEGQNYLQFAIRSRLKLFYRPAGLQGEPQNAAGALTFSMGSQGAAHALVVHNPTPYYVTITNITLNGADTSHKVDPGMVAPLSDLRLAVADLKQGAPSGSAISYESINDYGADVQLKATVSP